MRKAQELEHERSPLADIVADAKAPANPRGVKRQEQIEPCSAGSITVEQARIILGRESHLRDDELERLLDQMYALAHISIDALAELHWSGFEH
jgi:hypothetical protein